MTQFYTKQMKNSDHIQELSGYVSVKEAAKALGISTRRLYRHIERERLQAVRVANVLVIQKEELERIRYGISGRPRQNTPNWRIAAANDVHTWLQIFVRLREGREKELAEKLGVIRKSGEHQFPGTAARYIARSDQRSDEVQILLIWRGSLIPSEEAREAALEELRRDLADLVDWETARYETAQVLMHT